MSVPTARCPSVLKNDLLLKEENGVVSEVKEKECYTDNPMNEHASTGVYYFNKGNLIF